jgi:hypothetical protein
VAWWGSNKHSEVIATVNKKNGGDWNGYIDRWENYQSKMQGILGKNGVVEVKKFGVKMKGASLSDYVRKIGTRITVLRCLQSQESKGGSAKKVEASKLTPAAQADYEAGLVASRQGDYATASRKWTPLAEQGDAASQYELGTLYAKGRGVPKDNAKAAAWFAKAAVQGHDKGQKSLGDMYRKGKGVPKDAAQAVKWYREAALQGNALGQKNLGDMYRKGRGVTRDRAEALKWYRESANQGEAWGQLSLGRMYEMGWGGVSRDFAEAVKWHRKAAVQGNAKAAYRLGLMYERGTGIAQDATQARKWYGQAADEGLASAEKALRRLEKTRK